MDLTPPLDDSTLAGLISGLADAVVVADAAGTICSGTRPPSARSVDPGEAVGASLDLIIPERQRSPHWEGYREVMATATRGTAASCCVCRRCTPTEPAARSPSP